jgi:hypothetical protein
LEAGRLVGAADGGLGGERSTRVIDRTARSQRSSDHQVAVVVPISIEVVSREESSERRPPRRSQRTGGLIRVAGYEVVVGGVA